MKSKRTILITAGPTHEPIDSVRYIGNRSSGRLGIALAEAACSMGHDVILLLGPTSVEPSLEVGMCFELHRFRTTSDLEELLEQHWPDRADVLIMAAAVADYRPTVDESEQTRKIRRQPAGIVLKLDSTPDLVAACCRRKRADQCVIGFALEPREGLVEAAEAKIRRKGLDAIVANPLATMDSESIEAVLMWADGRCEIAGQMSKPDFARWFVEEIQ